MIINLDKNLFVSDEGILKQVSEKKKIKKINPIKRLLKYWKAKREMEREFNKEFEEEIRDDEDKIELTEEEQDDLDQIFDIIDGIGDRIAEVVVFEYFKIKELRDGRANGKYE